MRRALAKWFVRRANDDTNEPRSAKLLRAATRVDPTWSVPWYNLGLQAKYGGRWQESVRFNQRALQLNASDEAAWWNLGIAATAVRDWDEARRAWEGFRRWVNRWTGRSANATVGSVRPTESRSFRGSRLGREDRSCKDYSVQRASSRVGATFPRHRLE